MIISPAVISVSIFLLVYAAIVSEKINRMVVALAGAVLMVVLNILSQDEALQHIDFNTIGLLIGMMIIVNIIKRTGFFQYLAIKTAKLAKGDPMKIIIAFSVVTAVSSGLLDNVTTILLIVPVSLVIADSLKINAVPFIIAEVLAANIGGASTSIGDPTIIMISSSTGFSFLDFIKNTAPLMAILLVFNVSLVKFIYRKSLVVDEKSRLKVMAMNEKITITDHKLLVKSLIILVLTIAGFTLAEFTGLESATIAILGASALLLICGVEPEEIIVEVEWTTIFFFMGLFVLVGGLESTGVIAVLANKVISITHGDVNITTILILWMSAFLSSFLDNIPYVATMIPLVEHIQSVGIGNYDPVWWALAIGACLGGNGTIIGASANVVARGILEKHDRPISFFSFMKIAYPLMIASVAISTIYLAIFYL
jgi:Na+/H+ antiporter NhaD/arsenite permease-like protein